MPDKLRPEEYLHIAKGLAHGESTKVIHEGCGNRPSMHVSNEHDRWWAYCHRCGCPGTVYKEQQRLAVRAPVKTGYIPHDTVGVINAIVQAPYKFKDVIKRHNLAPFISRLTYSDTTERIYFPDETDSYLGLDITGKAIAKFYSPHKRSLSAVLSGPSGGLFITGWLDEYLLAISVGKRAILVMNSAGEKAALALVTRLEDTHAEMKGLRPAFLKDIKQLLEQT